MNEWMNEWTKEEEKILKKMYPTETSKNIADVLERSISAVKKRIDKMGLKKPQPANSHWSIKEEEILREMYATKKTRLIEDAIGRSRASIRNKASSLGLIKPRASRWTTEEVEILKKMYPTERYALIEKALEKSHDSIQNKAISMGLKRNARNSNSVKSIVIEALSIRPMTLQEIKTYAGKRRKWGTTRGVLANILGKNPEFSKKPSVTVASMGGGNHQATLWALVE